MNVLLKSLGSAMFELFSAVKDALADKAISLDEAKDILAKLRNLISELKNR